MLEQLLPVKGIIQVQIVRCLYLMFADIRAHTTSSALPTRRIKTLPKPQAHALLQAMFLGSPKPILYAQRAKCFQTTAVMGSSTATACEDRL